MFGRSGEEPGRIYRHFKRLSQPGFLEKSLQAAKLIQKACVAQPIPRWNHPFVPRGENPMTRNFPFLPLSSPRRSSCFAKLLAAAVVTSSCGLSSSQHVSAQSHNHSQEIRQVAGSSGGILSGLFGRGSSDDGQGDEPYRKATPVPSDREVNWNGIPFHNPNDGRIAATPQAPIRDPGAGGRAAQIARAPRPMSSDSGASRSAVPTPPSAATSTPRRITSKVESGATAHISSSGRPEPLSVTQSSRRPPSLQPKPTIVHLEGDSPALVAKPNAAAVAVDVKPVELVPKVSRKVIRSAPAAIVAKQADTPAKETVAANDSTSSRRSESEPVQSTLTDQTPQKVETPRTTTPHVARREIPRRASTLPASISDDAAENHSLAAAPSHAIADKPAPLQSLPQAPPTAVASTSPTATLGTPTLAATGQADVALQPISDRLPVDDEKIAGGSSPIQQDTPRVAQGDAFAPRGQTVASEKTPNYHSAGYGHHGIGAAPFASETESSSENSPAVEPSNGAVASSNGLAQPNAMRAMPQATAPHHTGTPTVAHNIAANSNTSATELPGIRVVTAGPRQVMIRQTHTYEIRVENRGSINAEGLVVLAHIPDWADVVGQQASRGDVVAATEEQVRNLQWRIERLDAGQSETLSVRLKAARSGTHDLDVDWTLAPQKRVVQVTVQEPELALTIDGPDEVVFGESKTYQIRVLNSGDGIAPAVVFTLSPDSRSPQSQRIGDIPAGKEAQFEVELTAQDLGELKIHGLAIGELELKAEADKTVRVLAADLEAELTGPEVKYQDTEAVYQLELTNQGTAASENVVATLQLPVGVTYQGGLEGATMIDNQLRWKIAALTPGAVRKYQFQCSMDSTGLHQFAFDCKGSAAGQTNVSLDTSVEAIADLVLSVVDPSAPAPVGEDVTYEIVIRNRGSKPAVDVQAIAQFSNGIEPKEITGHAGKVVTGQVLVEPIAVIEGGQEVRMTIVARAETGGHHRFRTEVRSGDTVLVAEEATHYLAPKTQRITRRSSADDAAQPTR